MSLYIRGMVLPKSCADCPLNYDYMGCSVNGVRWWSDTFVRLEFDPNKERLFECPLIDVPPHGRLVDADAFIDNCPELMAYEMLMPTIIPVDKEEP